MHKNLKSVTFWPKVHEKEVGQVEEGKQVLIQKDMAIMMLIMKTINNVNSIIPQEPITILAVKCFQLSQ